MGSVNDHAALFLDFLTQLLLRMLYQPKMWLYDILGMSLSDHLSLWCIQEKLGQTLLILHLSLIVFKFQLTDVRFSSLSTEIASKKVLQKVYFLLLYSEYISEPVLSYFYLSKEVESVLSSASFFVLVYTSNCTST